MSDIIKTEVSIDMTSITNKIEELLNDDAVMTEVHTEFANIIDPWVPYDTGNLSKDITIDASGVVYNADYAAKQYYGTEFNHKTEVHPLATAHWDQVAMQTEKEVLAAKVREILIRRINSGND